MVEDLLAHGEVRWPGIGIDAEELGADRPFLAASSVDAIACRRYPRRNAAAQRRRMICRHEPTSALDQVGLRG